MISRQITTQTRNGLDALFIFGRTGSLLHFCDGKSEECEQFSGCCESYGVTSTIENRIDATGCCVLHSIEVMKGSGQDRTIRRMFGVLGS